MLYKILIVEDHAEIRQVFRRIIEREPDLEVWDEAERGDTALGMLAAGKPSVVMLDLSVPGLAGIDLIGQIRKDHPDIPILVVSGQNDFTYAQRTLDAGASGYLDKLNCVPLLPEALRAVASGNTYLDKRLMARGLHS